MHWAHWRELWNLLYSWQGFTAGVVGVLAALYYGPRKVLEAWHWWMDILTDSKIREFMESHASKSEMGGGRSVTIVDISKGTGMSEHRVGNSLRRMRKKKLVKQHGENWVMQ
jgi:hypothetical protein